MRTVILVIVMLSGAFLKAQTDSLVRATRADSVLYVTGFSFQQGIYLDFAQFYSNIPVPKSAIIFEGDTSRLDYIRLALGRESFQWKDSTGKIHTTKTASIWGYSENKTVYIQWNGYFNRVVVIGSICHFAATVTTYMYAGPGTYQQYQYPVESMQQYVIDMKSGIIYDFNVQTMEFILQRDSVLSADYAGLKKKQKKDQTFIFLRKYNEKHPLLFPK